LEKTLEKKIKKGSHPLELAEGLATPSFSSPGFTAHGAATPATPRSPAHSFGPASSPSVHIPPLSLSFAGNWAPLICASPLSSYLTSALAPPDSALSFLSL